MADILSYLKIDELHAIILLLYFYFGNHKQRETCVTMESIFCNFTLIVSSAII